MRPWMTGTQTCLLGSVLLLAGPVFASPALANQSGGKHEGHHRIAPTAHLNTVSSHGERARSMDQYSPYLQTSYMHPISMRGYRPVASYAFIRHTANYGRHHTARSHGISCVPYAREVSGIEVAGNAWQWWDNAAGKYARGNRPAPGSVLNFRANGRMPLGHVAVVKEIINSREIIVDHANWPSGVSRGNISKNIAVVDVSEANNWSAVRVELGRGGTFGSVYPTYGFIYDRPDNGVVTASVTRPAPQPDINPVPSDLRPAAERPWQTFEEVAESPSTGQIDVRANAAALHRLNR